MAVHTVHAYPETCQVHVYKRSKTVWIASGTFQVAALQQKGRSESAAVKAWQDIAEFRYRTG